MTTITEPKVLDQATVNELRWLQGTIGAANADKGFHEEGEETRGLIQWLSGLHFPGANFVVDKITRLFPGFVRNYWTARLALIVTEAAEAIEELRNGRAVDETWYSRSKDAVFDEHEALNSDGTPRKPEGVPSELADIVIRAFDFADEAKIDLAAIIDEKLAYNATRGHKHGRTF